MQQYSGFVHVNSSIVNLSCTLLHCSHWATGRTCRPDGQPNSQLKESMHRKLTMPQLRGSGMELSAFIKRRNYWQDRQVRDVAANSQIMTIIIGKRYTVRHDAKPTKSRLWVYIHFKVIRLFILFSPRNGLTVV